MTLQMFQYLYEQRNHNQMCVKTNKKFKQLILFTTERNSWVLRADLQLGLIGGYKFLRIRSTYFINSVRACVRYS